MRAIIVGSRKCLDILLNTGADVNFLCSTPDDDATPVSEAVECETFRMHVNVIRCRSRCEYASCKVEYRYMKQQLREMLTV